MTLFDLFKLIRHYIKLVIILPVACAILVTLGLLVMPPTYVAKATLLTNGDIALAGGFAQTEATTFSKNGIEVSSKNDTSYRTVVIEAEGKDYGGCIAAANATVLAAANDYRSANNAAANDYRSANNQVSITTNEATYAESTSPSIPKTALIALLAGLFVAVCVVVVIDVVKMPIKSRNDIEAASNLPVIETIPTRNRGERLLANIRFLGDGQPATIAVVPVGLTGGTLTCAELASAFENVGTAVTRIKGNPHAQSLSAIALPEIVTIVECAPLSEGMGAVYIARDADVTILCASEWRDSRKALANVVEELQFAKANIGGVVFILSGYSEKSVF